MQSITEIVIVLLSFVGVSCLYAYTPSHIVLIIILSLLQYEIFMIMVCLREGPKGG